jgi:hypothetical protein
MADVVKMLPFPASMRDALVNRSGPGRLLDAVEAMEAGEFSRAGRLVRWAPEHYLDSVAWTNETARHLLDSQPAAAAQA